MAEANGTIAAHMTAKGDDHQNQRLFSASTEIVCKTNRLVIHCDVALQRVYGDGLR